MTRHQRRRLVQKDVVLCKAMLPADFDADRGSPSVVTSAVLAPLRSISAFVASVVPRMKKLE